VSFSIQHMKEVAQIAENTDISKIEEMIDILAEVKILGGRLFILGVGGSAGNASHAVNDFRKLVGIEAYAPTDNVSELTARTNDEGFETIFSGFLSTSKLNSKDCVLIFSVGGGDIERGISKNLCSAIDFAKLQNSKILGIVGREGGYTHKHADVCLVIPPVNPAAITPHSEAFQAIVWHLMVSHPKLKTNATKW
jgi:D-sedoheptulose 7-phosphate isomerase